MIDTEPLITAEALAAQTSLAPRTIRHLTTDPVHPLPVHRVGSRLLFKRSEFNSWLRERDARQADRPLSPKLALALRGHRR
jgi:hypothetical protein